VAAVFETVKSSTVVNKKSGGCIELKGIWNWDTVTLIYGSELG
jgi:hypothetical protein